MTSNPSGPSLTTAQREFASASHVSPGMQGTALSVLRPSGKARFADQTVDVVTEGEFISPDTQITVIQADGMRVVVRRA
jgi:membrane-bound serine protease (ClpP class)